MQLNTTSLSGENDTEDEEMQELVKAIQTMEKLILKKRPVPSGEGLLDFMDENDSVSNSNNEDQLLTESSIKERIPATPDRNPFNGLIVHANNTHSNSDVLQLELSRIQGLLLDYPSGFPHIS
jgi:hypothetical protein